MLVIMHRELLVGVKGDTGKNKQRKRRNTLEFCAKCTSNTLSKAENWLQTGQPGEKIGFSSDWLFC